MGFLRSLLEGSSISLVDVLINIGIGAVMSIALGWHFVRFGSTFSNRHKFARILSPLCLTTVLIFSVLSGSPALSLGLIGALSIVRFRTPIKEPEELIYLFLAISIGLGLGANQRVLTLVALPLILGVMALRSRTRKKSRRPSLYLNVDVPGTNGDSGAALNELIQVLGRHAAAVDMRRFDAGGQGMTGTFHVQCKDARQVVNIHDDIHKRFPQSTISFVEQSDMPGG